MSASLDTLPEALQTVRTRPLFVLRLAVKLLQSASVSALRAVPFTAFSKSCEAVFDKAAIRRQ